MTKACPVGKLNVVQNALAASLQQAQPVTRDDYLAISAAHSQVADGVGLTAADLPEIEIASGDTYGRKDLAPAGCSEVTFAGFRWQPGARTRVHDHPSRCLGTESGIVMHVIKGCLLEDVLELDEHRKPRTIASRIVKAGESVSVPPSGTRYLHRVSNPGPEESYSIHLYFPALDRERMTMFEGTSTPTEKKGPTQ